MSKHLAVLAGTLVCLVLLVPPAIAADSNQISIPFTKGKASLTEISASVTKTTSGSTIGIPFTLTIANPIKLPSNIHIAAIGGLNGVSGGPGNTVLTYQIFVAIDATGLSALPAASGGSAFVFKIDGGKFHPVKSGQYGAKASCTTVGSAANSLIKIGLTHLPPLNFEEFGTVLKKACPILHK